MFEKKKYGICIVVILSPLWQMASDKTTPTASGIGARSPWVLREKSVEKGVRPTSLHLQSYH
jgi:hypothetical protein